MSRIVVIGVFLILCTVLGAQIYVSLLKERSLQKNHDVLQAKLQEVTADYEKLRREFEYLERPENLEKELKARFNYRREGEKMIIVVPPKASSSEP